MSQKPPSLSLVMEIVAGQVNRHHIIPRSRRKNGRLGWRMKLDVLFHTVWHFLFDLMTPWEACRAVDKIMACGEGARSNWSWRAWVSCRTAIIEDTEKRYEKDPQGFSYLGVYYASRDYRIRLERHSDDFQRYWILIFHGLKSVDQVHAFIQQVMKRGEVHDWKKIERIRKRVIASVKVRKSRQRRRHTA